MSLRAILEAKIASLEEVAGQLKGLAELKQGIAEDTECPPENPESFRTPPVTLSITHNVGN